MDDIRQDLRYALRALRNKPTFAVIALITLALGIGATTAMFSVVNTVILRALPYRDADRLVQVWETEMDLPDGQVVTSEATFADWRTQSRTFDEIGAFRYRSFALTGSGDAEQIWTAMITPSLLRVLGVNPVVGRWFSEEEGQPGAPPAVLLTHGLWRRRFGGTTAIVGQSINLNGQPYNVIGVMPEQFRFPMPTMYPVQRRTRVDAYVPLPIGAQSSRAVQALAVIGRLAPSATLDHARSEMRTIQNQLAEQYGLENNTTRLVPLPQQVAGELHRPLLVLFGAVALLLLLACANIANLLLARGAGRQREMAVRAAIGANRGRIIQQLLTESVLLGAIGGLIGLVLAYWGVKLLVAAIPAGFPRVAEISVDARVAFFTLVVSLITGALFGIWPALRASGTDPQEALGESGRGNTETRRARRAADTLVVVQLAMSVVLLIGAGLLIRSFLQLAAVDPGFQSERMITGTIFLPAARYDTQEKQTDLYDALLGRLRGLPGVQAATLTGLVPFSGIEEFNGFRLAERTYAPGEPVPSARFYVVAPDYFKVMRIPIVRGRSLEEADRAGMPGAVVMNQAAAQKFWPQQDPIGQRIRRGNTEATVVGIVGDVRFSGLDAWLAPEMYWSYRQALWPVMGLVVRANRDERALAPLLRQAVRELDPNLPLSDVRTMGNMIAESYAQRRLNMLLLAIFSALGLLLSAIGLYGVLAQTVARRSHEIGVRVALGAKPTTVVRLIVGRGLLVTLIGLAAGAALAAPLTALLRSQVFGVSVHDPLTFAVVPTVLALVAFVASYIPAYRATRVDPLVVLRSE